MGILQPTDGVGYIHAQATELDRQLREGDGMLWPGDPRLDLRVGVLTAAKSGWDPNLKRNLRKGDVVARCYEVWRHSEDGSDYRIGRWRLEDFDRILFDLAPLRLDAPNRTDTLTAIDQHNARLEKENSERMRGKLVEMFEHVLKLWHDTNNPRNVFRQAGGGSKGAALDKIQNKESTECPPTDT